MLDGNGEPIQKKKIAISISARETKEINRIPFVIETLPIFVFIAEHLVYKVKYLWLALVLVIRPFKGKLL